MRASAHTDVPVLGELWALWLYGILGHALCSYLNERSLVMPRKGPSAQSGTLHADVLDTSAELILHRWVKEQRGHYVQSATVSRAR